MNYLSSTDSFLQQCFDLCKFKKETYGSLSTVFSKKAHHIKQEVKAVGYEFYKSDSINENYVMNGVPVRHSKVGYIGTNKSHICLIEDCFSIKTFQPKDKYQHRCLNPNEILVEVFAK